MAATLNGTPVKGEYIHLNNGEMKSIAREFGVPCMVTGQIKVTKTYESDIEVVEGYSDVLQFYYGKWCCWQCNGFYQVARLNLGNKDSFQRFHGHTPHGDFREALQFMINTGST